MNKKKLLFLGSLFFLGVINSSVVLVENDLNENNFIDKTKKFLSDSHSFVSAVITKPTQMGAVFPSSSSLAKTITRYVVEGKIKNKRILEVGAGTGIFTAEIVKSLQPGDFLDVVEVDSEMCAILNSQFKYYKNIKIHNISILDLNSNDDYDYIVSGLPFNIFEASFVKDVLYKYKDIVKQDGIISYFEYKAIPSITKALMTLFFMFDRKEKYQNVLNETKRFRQSFKVYEKENVWGNFLPAKVHFMKQA